MQGYTSYSDPLQVFKKSTVDRSGSSIGRGVGNSYSSWPGSIHGSLYPAALCELSCPRRRSRCGRDEKTAITQTTEANWLQARLMPIAAELCGKVMQKKPPSIAPLVDCVCLLWLMSTSRETVGYIRTRTRGMIERGGGGGGCHPNR